MNEDRDRIFLEHILDSIRAISEFSINLTEEELNTNRMKQNAIVREIEIIGEAIKNISQTLKEKHPEIPWRKITGTRDKIVHHYFGMNLEIVWNIIINGIPLLEKQIESVIQNSNTL
ncbi:DUF86 domain-containing protein [Candidatus Woesearchaeota archaeon]|jgi:uncharacterized protein with HEPN domain|nr:DUF86 domain-containing protein [Candidatus Woesearchaeota archaeon]